MKTIYSILVAILLLAPAAMSFRQVQPGSTKITLMAAGKNIQPADLQRTATVITGRLSDYFHSTPEVKINNDRNQVEIAVPGKQDSSVILSLTTSKGAAGFFETAGRNELVSILPAASSVFPLLTAYDEKNRPEVIGTISANDQYRCIEILEKMEKSGKVEFAWHNSEGGMKSLYALKCGAGGNAAVTGKDIQTAVCKDDRILITLRKDAVKAWSELTGRALGRSVALTLDGEVIFAPKVMDRITGGKIEVTGKFDRNELMFISSILNNGELPVKLVAAR